jgi:hypothetical protein
MYHVNDPLVRTMHESRLAEIIRDSKGKDLARFSSNGSSNLVNRATGRVGDSLIRLGQKLKGGDSPTPSSMHLRFDCD